MYDREVRSGNSRRKVRNKGGTTTRRPSLTLLDPLLMNFRARVSHHHSPCRAAVRTCSAAMELTYKAIRQRVYPAHCRDQRTRVTRGKWHGYTRSGASFMPNLERARWRTWSAHVEVQRWRS